jgi:hypothetical protein
MTRWRTPAKPAPLNLAVRAERPLRSGESGASRANCGHTGDQTANPIAVIRDEPRASIQRKAPYQFSYRPSSVAHAIWATLRSNDWLTRAAARTGYASRTTSDGCRRRPHSDTDANPSTGGSLPGARYFAATVAAAFIASSYCCVVISSIVLRSAIAPLAMTTISAVVPARTTRSMSVR